MLATMLKGCSSAAQGWDISKASYLQSFDVSAQNILPRSVFFKPDGTKMYCVDGYGDEVDEYSLSTAWDISTASYVRKFGVSAQETSPVSVSFKPDGTGMYVSGTSGDDINQYNLSTAWNVGTASYVRRFSDAGRDRSPNSISFKPDGTKMYIFGGQYKKVYEYNLSTAWNIGTASYVRQSSVLVQDLYAYSIFLKPDGTKLYMVGNQNDSVYEYDILTAWDISTATYLQSFSVAAQNETPLGAYFKPDGKKMYVIGQFPADAVFEYDL